jgi:hypothetical protein
MYKGKSMNDLDDEVMEFNIGTDASPRMVNLAKGTTPDERKDLLDLIREFKYVFTWSYGYLKYYQEDVIQRSILLKEGVKTFKKKLSKINPKITH